jgi:ankyrin repeat protein
MDRLLRIYIKNNNIEELLLFLSRNKLYDINSNDEDGLSPLHLALLYGYDECVDILLKHGANINATTKVHSVLTKILLNQPFESRYRVIFHGGTFMELLKLPP